MTVERVAVVGAGFSGAMTAVHLCRRARAPLEVVLIEPSARFATGVAYSTPSLRHLLNVPAGNMSALPEAPDDFVDWLARSGSRATPGSFVPRKVYGDYLAHVLERETGGALLTRVPGRVRDIQPLAERFRLVLADGRELWARAVVLAPGNFAPAPLEPFEAAGLGQRYAADPWQRGALDGLAPEAPLLFVGTGQTMVDLALELEERGHRGPLLALSRRGLLHRSHRSEGDRHPLELALDVARVPRTALGLLREVRALVLRANVRGHDWQDVMAALRPLTPALWKELELGERARFLARLRPFWDVHRHRLAPEVGRQLAAWLATGRLAVVAGRVREVEVEPDGLRVSVEPRGTGTRLELRATRAFNCTGPERSPTRHELLANLRRRGCLRLDPLGLGVSADPAGRVLDARGRPQARMFLVGPLRLGDLWECVAVPELRVQALEVALHVLAACEPAAERVQPAAV